MARETSSTAAAQQQQSEAHDLVFPRDERAPGDTDVLTDILSRVRFAAPRPCAADTGDVCMARAYLMPARTAFRIRVRSCGIVKTCESRKNCYTLYVKTSERRSRSSLTHFLMSLDARVIEVAKANVDAWFKHNMNADLIEEYYKGNTTPIIDHGVAARFAVDGRLPPSIKQLVGPSTAGCADLHLQLVGVQFRRQYFTCIWKVISCDPSPTAAAALLVNNCLLTSDDEDADQDADRELGDEFGPTPDEYADMRACLMDRLLALERDTSNTLNRVQELICILDTSPHMDCNTLAHVSDEVDALNPHPSS